MLDAKGAEIVKSVCILGGKGAGTVENISLVGAATFENMCILGPEGVRKYLYVTCRKRTNARKYIYFGRQRSLHARTKTCFLFEGIYIYIYIYIYISVQKAATHSKIRVANTFGNTCILDARIL